MADVRVWVPDLLGVDKGGWVPQEGDASGAAHVTLRDAAGNDASGLSAYGNYPERDWLTNSGSATADDVLLFTALNLTAYSEHVIHSTAGTVDVEVTVDGTNWTASATNPVAMLDIHSTTPGTMVLTLTVGKVGVISGKYSGIRVRQNGPTAATVKMGSY